MQNLIEIEEGVYGVPLILAPSLERERKDFEEILLAAQRRLRNFAIQNDWTKHVKKSFMNHAEIYDDKNMFDRELLKLSGAEPSVKLPKTYSAALEQNKFISVSPELYGQNYPDGIEDKSFEKLITHEMAHRLHIRILNKNEDAMGPIWFFEGFAIYACGQFENYHPKMEFSEILEIIKNPNRGSYKKYSIVFRYFLQKTSIHELIEHAGDNDFLKWLQDIARR